MHDYLTVYAVYGHDDGETAIPALITSIESLPGCKNLLLSIRKPKDLPKEINWRQILPMNYKQYSLFMMFCLQNFIETEFCLNVQDDGWVLNKNRWSVDFLNYDYIGAPCHAAICDNQFFINFSWTNNPRAVVIQNGGFSLRSRKFLRAASQYGIMYHFSDIDVLLNEDVQLTGIYRSALENVGIKFAPNSLAKNFSIEFLGPTFHNDLDFSKLFGIHGKIRKLIGKKNIFYTCSREKAEKIFREGEVIRHLFELGYVITFAK